MTSTNTTINDARKVIATAFKEACNDASMPYLLENVNNSSLEKGNAPWAQLKVVIQQSEFRALTGPLVKYEGVVEIVINIPTGRGMALVDEKANYLVEKFRQQQIDGVRFKDLMPIDMGVEGSWHKKKIKVMTYFYNRETR